MNSDNELIRDEILSVSELSWPAEFYRQQEHQPQESSRNGDVYHSHQGEKQHYPESQAGKAFETVDEANAASSPPGLSNRLQDAPADRDNRTRPEPPSSESVPESPQKKAKSCGEPGSVDGQPIALQDCHAVVRGTQHPPPTAAYNKLAKFRLKHKNDRSLTRSRKDAKNVYELHKDELSDIVPCKYASVATAPNAGNRYGHGVPLQGRDRDKAIITFLQGHPNKSPTDKEEQKESLKETVGRFEKALKELRKNYNSSKKKKKYGEAHFEQFQYAIDCASNYDYLTNYRYKEEHEMDMAEHFTEILQKGLERHWNKFFPRLKIPEATNSNTTQGKKPPPANQRQNEKDHDQNPPGDKDDDPPSDNEKDDSSHHQPGDSQHPTNQNGSSGFDTKFMEEDVYDSASASSSMSSSSTSEDSTVYSSLSEDSDDPDEDDNKGILNRETTPDDMNFEIEVFQDGSRGIEAGTVITSSTVMTDAMTATTGDSTMAFKRTKDWMFFPTITGVLSNLTSEATDLHKRLRKCINAATTADECVHVFDDPEFQECLLVIRSCVEQYHTYDEESEDLLDSWAIHWAQRVSSHVDWARTLEQCRKTTFLLLKKVCDIWNWNSLGEETRPEDDQVLQKFAKRRIDQIVPHVLAMDRANALYHMMPDPAVSVKVRGLYWYSPYDDEARKIVDMPPNPYSPSINKRYIWLYQKFYSEKDVAITELLQIAFPPRSQSQATEILGNDAIAQRLKEARQVTLETEVERVRLARTMLTLDHRIIDRRAVGFNTLCLLPDGKEEDVGELLQAPGLSDPSSTVNANVGGDPYVFLSYRGPDTREAIARPTHWFLTKVLGIKSFLDITAGVDFSRQQLEAAYSCSHALVLLSPSYRESRFAVMELNTFMKRAKQGSLVVLPVLWRIQNGDGYSPLLGDISCLKSKTEDPNEYMVKSLWPSLVQVFKDERSQPHEWDGVPFEELLVQYDALREQGQV